MAAIVGKIQGILGDTVYKKDTTLNATRQDLTQRASKHWPRRSYPPKTSPKSSPNLDNLQKKN